MTKYIMKTGACTRGALLINDSVDSWVQFKEVVLLFQAWFVMQDDVIHTMVRGQTKRGVSREGSELFQFHTQ